jgi:hypothetical protein
MMISKEITIQNRYASNRNRTPRGLYHQIEQTQRNSRNLTRALTQYDRQLL